FVDRIDAHTYEHSLEVQLPFLQYKMKKDFKIVPIVIGTQNLETCKQIANALKPYFNSKNLFVISTDFSHYPKYEDAVKSDENVYKAILTNSTKNLIKAIEENEKQKIPSLATSMCGLSAVMTLLYLSENNPNIEMNLIQYKNSGDSEYGEKNRVVGYCAITASLKENNKMEKTEFELDSKDKKDLLEVARKTITAYIKEGKVPKIDAENFSENIKMNCGAFVTLHKHGDLRG
ncbi:MAG: AmmeMemoRadiSam system protein B, partial [Ignavibacteria bacterium]|nr:AmmeMemoRadiSam system protein B [Ignavibacteria bacterium]